MYRIKLSKLPVNTVSGRPKHETFGLSPIDPVDSEAIILMMIAYRKLPMSAKLSPEIYPDETGAKFKCR